MLPIWMMSTMVPEIKSFATGICLRAWQGYHCFMRNSQPCEDESKVLFSGDLTPMITRTHNSFATSKSVVLGFDLVVHGVAHD